MPWVKEASGLLATKDFGRQNEATFEGSGFLRASFWLTEKNMFVMHKMLHPLSRKWFPGSFLFCKIHDWFLVFLSLI